METTLFEKITSLFLANIIPAGVLQAQLQEDIPPPRFDMEIAPLAKVLDEEIAEPVINARSALVIETHSNEVLYEKNVWEVVPIASLTKLMTALVVREQLKDLDQVVTVGDSILSIDGSKMNLRVGEQITVHELLRGMLIASGNDAAQVLSETAAGSQEAFVVMMNERKKALGLNSTNFADPSGYSNGNVSTAFELAHLAKQVFRDPVLREIMLQKEASISSVDGSIVHDLTNTNRLLGSTITDRVLAGKTGTTPSAGQCLVTLIRHQEEQQTMMILLGSGDRFTEMESLISWVDQKFWW